MTQQGQNNPYNNPPYNSPGNYPPRPIQPPNPNEQVRPINNVAGPPRPNSGPSMPPVNQMNMQPKYPPYPNQPGLPPRPSGSNYPPNRPPMPSDPIEAAMGAPGFAPAYQGPMPPRPNLPPNYPPSGPPVPNPMSGSFPAPSVPAPNVITPAAVPSFTPAAIPGVRPPQNVNPPQYPPPAQYPSGQYGATPNYGQPTYQSPQGLPLAGSYPIDDLFESTPIRDVPLASQNAILPNCPSTFHSCTMNLIPQNVTLLSKSNAVLGLLVSPFHHPKEEDIPIPLLSDGVIVRCRRCRTYINPFVEFLEQGSRWRCNLCELINDVPASFDYDAQKQQYIDRSMKPEITNCVIEYIAPSEYMVRPPQPPVYLFMLDVSFAAVQSGYLNVVSKSILESLDDIPKCEGRTQVGFLTYDSCIHFYNLNAGLSDSQMLVTSELDDVFLPSPNDLLVNLADSRSQIENLLKKLPILFRSTQQSASALGPALKAGHQLLSNIGGKLVSFQTILPTLGDGGLKDREESKFMGTPKESQLYEAANVFYKTFAIDCSKNQVAFDMFLANGQSVDLSTIMGAIRFTGGNLFYYRGFNAGMSETVLELRKDIKAFLSRPIGLEAVMRIRASKGIALTNYHGNFFLRSSDLLSLPNVSPDNSFAVQMTIEENVTTPFVSFQTALLHTASTGERRIRVITSCLPVSTNLTEIIHNVDQGSLATLLAKMAVERSLTSKLEDARDALMNKCADILGAYRSLTGNNPQLMVPPNLKHFPLLVLGLLKHLTFRIHSSIPIDVRMTNFNTVRTMYRDELIQFVHPNFYALHNMADEIGLPGKDGRVVLPSRLNLTCEKFDRNGLYLLDDGKELFLWICKGISPAICTNVFDRPTYESIPSGKLSFPVLNNPLSQRVMNIIERLRKKQPYYMPLTIVKEDSDPVLRTKFFWNLIEDRVENSFSYPQWLSFIRDKVNSKKY